MKNLIYLTLSFSVILALFVSKPAAAYFATLDDGKILKKGEYQLLFSPQFVLSGNTGFNASTRFDFGFNDSSNFRAILGTGSTSFFSGLFYKWIPIPDYGNQPALGISSGFVYATVNNSSSLSLRFHPMISKKYKVDWADVTPYASLPFGTYAYNGVTQYPLQLALGAEIKPVELKKLSFFGEIGFNISNAFGYVSLAAALEFDDQNGFKVE